MPFTADDAERLALELSGGRQVFRNGNGRNGAASAEAVTLHRLGYPVLATGNAPRNDYATTVVMYRPGMRNEGIRLGRDLHLKVVGPLDGLHTTALHGAKLALILGVG